MLEIVFKFLMVFCCWQSINKCCHYVARRFGGSASSQFVRMLWQHKLERITYDAQFFLLYASWWWAMSYVVLTHTSVFPVATFENFHQTRKKNTNIHDVAYLITAPHWTSSHRVSPLTYGLALYRGLSWSDHIYHEKSDHIHHSKNGNRLSHSWTMVAE